MGAMSCAQIFCPGIATFMTDSQIFLTVLACAVAHLLIAVLCVKESLPEDVKKEWAQVSLNPIKAFAILRRTSLFTLLALVVLLSGIAMDGIRDVSANYVRGRFDFSKQDNRWLSMVRGGVGVGVSFIVLPLILRWFPNRRVLLVGLFAQSVASLIVGIAWNVPLYYVGTCLGALGVMAFPAIAAIKSNNVDETEQGTVQGALVGIQEVTVVCRLCVCVSLSLSLSLSLLHTHARAFFRNLIASACESHLLPFHFFLSGFTCNFLSCVCPLLAGVGRGWSRGFWWPVRPRQERVGPRRRGLGLLCRRPLIADRLRLVLVLAARTDGRVVQGGTQVCFELVPVQLADGPTCVFLLWSLPHQPLVTSCSVLRLLVSPHPLLQWICF
jgi:hypothetical protein